MRMYRRIFTLSLAQFGLAALIATVASGPDKIRSELTLPGAGGRVRFTTPWGYLMVRCFAIPIARLISNTDVLPLPCCQQHHLG